MANIYRTLLREIEADGFQVLHQRISLTPLRKLWIARARTGAAAEPRRMKLAVIGAGWAGLAAAVRGHRAPAIASRCSRWPPSWAGARAAVDSGRAWRSTTASTS